MDSISNMIIMIKNGSLAGKPSVAFPYSKIKHAISECLKKEGDVKDFSKKVKKGCPMLEVELVYEGKRPKITEAERISKQSRRGYFRLKDIQSVKGGTGVLN